MKQNNHQKSSQTLMMFALTYSPLWNGSVYSQVHQLRTGTKNQKTQNYTTTSPVGGVGWGWIFTFFDLHLSKFGKRCGKSCTRLDRDKFRRDRCRGRSRSPELDCHCKRCRSLHQAGLGRICRQKDKACSGPLRLRLKIFWNKTFSDSICFNKWRHTSRIRDRDWVLLCLHNPRGWKSLPGFVVSK